MAKKNYYKILQVPETASEGWIRGAYLKLCKKYHPDINPKYEELFKDINVAYETLKDPIKRAEYDKKLHASEDEPKPQENPFCNQYYYEQYEIVEPIVNILDDFWQYKFETVISSIWKRNIFVLFTNSLLYDITLSLSVCDRLKKISVWCINLFRKNKIKTKEKTYKNVWVNWVHQTSQENIWNTLFLTIFINIMVLSKFIYHACKVIWWILVHIVKPVAWWLLALFGIMKMSDAIKNRNHK